MASKSKKNNVKFKWTKELLILITAIIIMIAATVILAIPNKNVEATKEYNEAIEAYNTTNSTSYSFLPNENVFRNVDYEELQEKIEDEDVVYVLYGSKNNGVFLQYLSTIHYTADAEEVEEVYIYSSLWYEEAEDVEAEDFKNELNEKQDFFNDGKSSDVAKFELKNYPALLVFENGVLTFNSQTYAENSVATWDMFINKVFVKAE